jgi:hypothetical protein
MRDGLSEGVLACRLTSYIGHIQYICLACNVVVFSVLLFVKPFLLMVRSKPPQILLDTRRKESPWQVKFNYILFLVGHNTCVVNELFKHQY